MTRNGYLLTAFCVLVVAITIISAIVLGTRYSADKNAQQNELKSQCIAEGGTVVPTSYSFVCVRNVR